MKCINGKSILWYPAVVQEASMWQSLKGCSGERESTVNNNNLECWSYCPDNDKRLQMCGMKGVGHDTNNPTQGYPFGLAR